MRNAAAHFDDDFGIEEPARKKASGRSTPKSGSKRKKKGRNRFALDIDMQRVARYAAIGMSATVAIGIMVNALVMQKERHPAPLFGASIAPGEVQVKAAPPKATAPQAESTNAKVAPPPPPVEETPSAPQETGRASGQNDMIGRLIEGKSVPADHSSHKTVAESQRALAKLGFAVKPTGTFGPQTKKAIERFEKDHHLPVKGELSRKIVKLLASQSGIKIEQ